MTRPTSRFVLLLSLALSGLGLCSVGMASTVTLDLDSLTNGDMIGPGNVQPSSAVEISSTDGLGVTVFDSDPMGPNSGGDDGDLLVDRGNLLIIQNPAFSGVDMNDRFIEPDDDAAGGTISFDWQTPVTLFSIDLVDIDNSAAVTVTLTDGQGDTRVYSVPDDWTGDIESNEVGFGLLDLTTLAPQPGPNSGEATAVEDAGFDASGVELMTVFFSGSGATNNIVFVPEPAAAAWMLFGALSLAIRRKR